MKLTARENEIMKLVLKGLNNPQIAKELCITIYTVKKHLENVYRVNKVSNRVQAIMKYLQENNDETTKNGIE